MVTKTQQISIEDYNYSLPDERIAKFPLPKRDESKLLLYRDGKVSESVFKHITDYLPEGSLMVFNNTRVIQARLLFQRATGAQIEVFCLDPAAPHDYELIFQQTEACNWICLIGNAKKWKEPVLSREITVAGQTVRLSAEKVQSYGETHQVRFSWDGGFSFAEVLDAAGELPIPPYLHRKTEESDLKTYQTVYSKIKGSVAAPTAGLHFTPELLEEIRAKGVEIAPVTLHVGLGTFRPVKVDDVEHHHMHSEFYMITEESAQKINHAKEVGHRVICVGTTSCRTIESAADENGRLKECSGWTEIFIYPGYHFKMIDALITNFHLPESTLVMLVSALAGKENIMHAYETAVQEKYRFFSFGDAMIII